MVAGGGGADGGPGRGRRKPRRPHVFKPRPLPRHPSDSPAESRQRRSWGRRRFRLTEVGVAAAALLLSASAFLIGGAMYLRGSEIVASPPEQILLYRDAGPNGAELWLSVPVALINAASTDYGDVVTRATLRLGTDEAAPQFEYKALAEPVMLPAPDAAAMARRVERAVENCPTGARCIPGLGHYVIERPKRLLDVPGGSSRSEHLSFTLAGHECLGAPTICRDFDGYRGALAHLRRRGGLTVQIDLNFQFDEDQRLTCTVDTRHASWADVLNYLDRTGWVTPACTQPRSH